MTVKLEQQRGSVIQSRQTRKGGQRTEEWLHSQLWFRCCCDFVCCMWMAAISPTCHTHSAFHPLAYNNPITPSCAIQHKLKQKPDFLERIVIRSKQFQTLKLS